MQFADFELMARPGDVLLFRGTAWYSRLIELWTGSPYSHAAVVAGVLACGNGRACVIEATEPAVRLYPLDSYEQECRRRKVRFDWYQLGDEIDRWRVVQFCLDQWGKRYVSLKQFASSFSRLGLWIRKKLGLKLVVVRDRQRWFCSELVAAALENAGCQPRPGHWRAPVMIAPGEIPAFPCLTFMGTVEC